MTPTPDPPTAHIPSEEPKAFINGELSNAETNAIDAATRIQQRYQEERDKRLRDDGSDQYIDLDLSDKFKRFREDPWLEASSDTSSLKDSSRCKYLVLGAGIGGLYFAVKLVEFGLNVDDIRIVDPAGGFGGTWYWNRYPGLMCDVESYIYLPLLEEMGYMPAHKYSYGPEIRSHVNNIASKWNLTDKAMFRTKVDELVWDETDKEWVVKMRQERTGQDDVPIKVRSQFVISATGLLLHPKLPDLPGLDQLQAHCFHTSRWDYNFTGGSPENPSLVNLKDKRVGIIGTGATAVQSVPHLAKWAKHLTIFQRTPSAVDKRDNHPTDQDWWQQEVQSRKGWQRERSENFNAYATNDETRKSANKVNDGWSKMAAYRALIGAPGIVPMDKIPEFVGTLHAQDMPRSEMVRARVDEIVTDRETAQKLKAWYPSWCKRPCFHDEYLQTFNQDNVTLVDTNGKGVDGLSEKGVLVGGKEYELDLLIFSTGFRAPAQGSPAVRAGMTITGRSGKSLDDKWEDSIGTLHGVVSHDFPNLFWPGPWQAAACPNQSYVLDILSTHVAYILSEAQKHAAKQRPGAKFSIEPSMDAEEAWSMQVMYRAAAFAGLSGCTPSYFNAEGATDRLPMEERMKMARGAIWGEGVLNFKEVIDAWRERGGLEGLDIRV